jgi:hypothetical protein
MEICGNTRYISAGSCHYAFRAEQGPTMRKSLENKGVSRAKRPVFVGFTPNMG